MKKYSFIFLFLILISCNENLSPEEYKEVKVADLYTLSVPEYMIEMNNLNKEATLQYANILKEAYTVVVHENKYDFIAYLKTINTYNDQVSVLENYSQTQINFFEKNAQLKRIEASDFTKINKLNARKVKLKGDVVDREIGYALCFIEGKDNLYMIMNWTRLNRLTRFESTFQFINNSFKLIKN